MALTGLEKSCGEKGESVMGCNRGKSHRLCLSCCACTLNVTLATVAHAPLTVPPLALCTPLPLVCVFVVSRFSRSKGKGDKRDSMGISLKSNYPEGMSVTVLYLVFNTIFLLIGLVRTCAFKERDCVRARGDGAH